MKEIDLYPLKGRFAPGEEICARLETGDTGATWARVTLWHLEEVWKTWETPLQGDATQIGLGAFPQELLGLGLEVEVFAGTQYLYTLHTSVDISKEGRIVRYGFLSDFSPADDGEEAVRAMAKYHLNHVQFYDWSYRHHQLVAREAEYLDMMGKRNSLPVIRRKAEACHRRGMRAMAYGAVYASDKTFQEHHPAWGLYARENTPLTFIDTFYFMNVQRGCPWRGHLYRQYREAMDAVGFDGIHMDTYGYPKAALDAAGQPVYLQKEFPSLIDETHQALSTPEKEAALIFNNVGAWPMRDTMNCRQAAVYMEIWPPYTRYHHLKALILAAAQSKKPVVLAAYMEPFRLDTPERALYAALLCLFAVAMHGATQLCLGEENAVLTQGYYVDHTKLNQVQARALRAYHDFFVRYEEWLYNPALEDVSMTHCGGDNREYRVNVPYSLDGQGDTLWLCIRECEDMKLISMLNLQENDDRWNAGKEKPRPVENVIITVQTLRPVTEAIFASPDLEHGKAQALCCQSNPTERGYDTSVVIPRIEIGGLLCLKDRPVVACPARDMN